MSEASISESGGKVIEFPKNRRPHNIRFSVPEDRGKMLYFPGTPKSGEDSSLEPEFWVDEKGSRQEAQDSESLPPELELSPEELEKLDEYKDTAKKPEMHEIWIVIDDLREEGYDIPEEILSFLPEWLNESWWSWEDDRSAGVLADEESRFPNPVGDNVNTFQMELAANAILQQVLVGASIKNGISKQGENMVREVLGNLETLWGAAEEKYDFDSLHGSPEAKDKLEAANKRRKGIKLVLEKGIPAMALFMQRYFEMSTDKREHISEKPFFQPPSDWAYKNKF